ncbi:NADPH:quinone oxidoreductase family protein [Inhella proteolytica]|uniref:NADPH:quinone oxidoreductase family protein n=1 Tax=Inhella proteolytica TaxID=2795029 RepID=A0A931J1S6_9BURK|nr:NADPH:quinone oxidoreductase family protein [Inhella proteolytica]MBH9576761.1 NADPH:quinone oxidoreductase family protein [Inhella proteolytica]
MHAWICEQATGLDGLRWAELPDPQPGPGQVRVAIEAASLNFPDWLIVNGQYQMKPPLPFVPGAEFCGRVVALGAGVDAALLGRRVAGFAGLGGFATQTVAPAAALLPLPESLPPEAGAALLLTYGTVAHALQRAALRAGETLLVLGAAGGVGTAAIQLAKAAGARVLAVASTPEKRQACLDIGADQALPTEGLREALKAAASQGVDAVLDPVGGPLAEAALRALAWRGRYLVVGFAQGQIPALPWNLLLLKEAALLGVWWGEFAKREPAANAALLAGLLPLWEQGSVRPVLDQVLPMRELPAAFARMTARAVVGKLVLRNE